MCAIKKQMQSDAHEVKLPRDKAEKETKNKEKTPPQYGGVFLHELFVIIYAFYLAFFCLGFPCLDAFYFFQLSLVYRAISLQNYLCYPLK